MELSETFEAVPQFGLCEAGAPYHPRPCAFGIAVDDQGRIALVRIARETYVNWDLPGGMIDPGEGEAQALVREFREETGWTVTPQTLVTRAEQFTITRTGERRRNQCGFFLCDLVEVNGGKIEDSPWPPTLPTRHVNSLLPLVKQPDWRQLQATAPPASSTPKLITARRTMFFLLPTAFAPNCLKKMAKA